jgi:hypothetical protein
MTSVRKWSAVRCPSLASRRYRATKGHRAALVVQATLRAYNTAIADGADDEAAFRVACSIYRRGYPRDPEHIVHQMVAGIVHCSAPARSRASRPQDLDQAPRPARGRRRHFQERAATAAKLAYIMAVADGATPPAAFEVAKAAFRARHPELSGARLDDVVARVLATDKDKVAPSKAELSAA